MFAGTLTRNVETAAAEYTGMIHSTRFDIAIQLEARAKMSARSPDYDVTAVNKSGRKVRIGTAWNETGNTSGNPYISMQIDVGLGPFRVNAVQTKEARAAQSGAFEIIPLVSNGLMKSGSISGELTAMDADNAFTGYIANMMFDLEFMLIENSYKSEETHPDYRIEVSSPRGTPIRVGSAWMAKSSRTGNDYLSLLINTPDGDLRVNAVQNEEQRGGQTFSIIPFKTHPDYRIEVSSPRGTPIRVGSAWMAKSSRTGNDYLSLLINTPDGDLRVNAVQSEEQRGGQTFSIIPFIDSGEQPQDAGAGLSLVA